MTGEHNINSTMPASRLKGLLKSLLRRFGLDLVRYQPAPVRPINILDLAVRAALAQCPNFYFMQIGANDGIRHDPLRSLIQEFGLRGLLIEPLPDMFAQLRENYADQPQLAFKNAAVSSGQARLTLARFKADAPIHDDYHGLASADTERIEQLARAHGIEKHVEHVEVPCVTFEELIAEYAIERLDLLVIDVEGLERELLRAAFEAGLAPRIIFIEFVHLTPADRASAERFLTGHDYGLAYTGIDLIAVRPCRCEP